MKNYTLLLLSLFVGFNSATQTQPSENPFSKEECSENIYATQASKDHKGDEITDQFTLKNPTLSDQSKKKLAELFAFNKNANEVFTEIKQYARKNVEWKACLENKECTKDNFLSLYIPRSQVRAAVYLGTSGALEWVRDHKKEEEIICCLYNILLYETARSEGNVDVVKNVLDLGADPNVNTVNKHVNIFTGSPLTNASKTGNTAIIKLLLDYKADIEMMDERNCYKPLQMAVAYDNYDAAKLLIMHGANVNTKSVNGTPLLCEATSSNMTALLLNAGAIDYENKALINAAGKGNTAIIKLLLDYKVDIEMMDRKYGYRPLQMAVVCDNYEAAKLLIMHGANVNTKSVKGLPLLGEATSSNMTALLLNAGAIDYENKALKEAHYKLDLIKNGIKNYNKKEYEIIVSLLEKAQLKNKDASQEVTDTVVQNS